MGRRKIVIEALEDDRLRTVTFSRRKGGLIKKAHELATLCSSQVAVLVFDDRDACHLYSSHNFDDMIRKYNESQFKTKERKRKYETDTADKDKIPLLNEYKVEGVKIKNTKRPRERQFHEEHEKYMIYDESPITPLSSMFSQIQYGSNSQPNLLVEPSSSLVESLTPSSSTKLAKKSLNHSTFEQSEPIRSEGKKELFTSSDQSFPTFKCLIPFDTSLFDGVLNSPPDHEDNQW